MSPEAQSLEQNPTPSLAGKPTPRRIAMVAYTHFMTDPRCRREAEAAAHAGWEVHFYALARRGRASTRRIGKVVLHELALDRYRGGRTGAYIWSYIRFGCLAGWAVLRDSLRCRYRIVHVNTMPDFMVLTALVPRWLGARVILDIHDVMPEIYMAKFSVPATHWKIRLIRAVEVWSARLAHAILTAEGPKAELLARHGIPREKISVLLNLPDESLLGTPSLGDPVLPACASPGDPASGSGLSLVYHGTLARRHGLDRAIQAVALLRERIPGIHLQIYGEGDALPDLRRLSGEAGLGSQVQFHEGFRPLEEIVPALRTAHLAVIPTRCESGTDYMLPTKMLEYLALGIPVLVTPTHTVRHYFGESHPLYLEDPSPTVLAERIAWVAGNYAEARRLTEEWQRSFFRRYSWASHRGVYLELLEQQLLPRSERSHHRHDRAS